MGREHMQYVLLVVAGLLTACSSPGTLSYSPPAHLVSGPAVIMAVEVLDKRDEKPNRIATIRGGYGNPLKVMDTTTPVADQVRAVLIKALQARSMLSDSGPDRIQVTLYTLYADHYMGRKAELLFDFVVSDRTGRSIYADRITKKDYEFTFFDNGIFSSIDTLGKTAEALLGRAVDEALDKPALRAALGARAATVPGV